jgi:prophage antirepressor-like protein
MADNFNTAFLAPRQDRDKQERDKMLAEMDAAIASTQPQPSPMLFTLDSVATGDRFSLSALEQDGQSWFVAADVCKALGLHPTATRRLDDDEKGLRYTQTLGGRQQIVIINESGMYRLIFGSKKAGAQRFRKWVTSEVIPSIRKHGGYINGQEALSTPEQAQTLQVIHQEAQRVGMCAAEEREARSSTLRLMSRTRSYGPGGRKQLKGKI